MVVDGLEITGTLKILLTNSFTNIVLLSVK